MGIPNRLLAFLYRAGASLVIALGIGRVTGVLSGDPSWNSFAYYTVLSNVLCLVWMFASAVRTVRDAGRDGWTGYSTPGARFEAAVMMAITVTMLVYLLVLVPSLYVQPGAYEPFTLTDNLIHIVTPLLVIVDWVLFIPKGRIRPLDPVLWSIIPLAYLVFAFVYGSLGGEFAPGVRYPYPFLDVDANGVVGVLAWVIGLTASGIALGYAYFGLDRLFSRGADAHPEARHTT